MKGLYEPHLALTAKVMDMRLQRQNVVMSNLANIETPHYKPRTLEFEKDLQSALALDSRGKLTRTGDGHLPSVFQTEKFGPEWTKKFKPRVVWGQDNVDLDKEVATMAKNTMMYNALTTVLKKSFEGVSTVIAEGQK